MCDAICRYQEEELRQSGEAKYHHLNEDLHVLIEVFAPPAEAYARMGHALEEIKKFLIPVCKHSLHLHQLRAKPPSCSPHRAGYRSWNWIRANAERVWFRGRQPHHRPIPACTAVGRRFFSSSSIHYGWSPQAQLGAAMIYISPLIISKPLPRPLPSAVPIKPIYW